MTAAAAAIQNPTQMAGSVSGISGPAGKPDTRSAVAAQGKTSVCVGNVGSGLESRRRPNTGNFPEVPAPGASGLSDEQAEAVSAIVKAARSGRRRFVLAGLAGTGKTTVVRAVVERLPDLWIVTAAPTGKAAAVLRGKGGGDAVTLHSFLYRARQTAAGVAFDRKTQHVRPDLLIVDEASMIDRRLLADVEALGCPTLFVGDPGQLEPVGDDPKLLSRPDAMLTTIHRQAGESPIIRFAGVVRESRPFRPGRLGEVEVRPQGPGLVGDVAALAVRGTMALCGFNRTRVAINRAVRDRLGIDSPLPVAGEPLVCLRNNPSEGIFNGQTYRVADCVQHGKGTVRLYLVDDLGTRFSGVVARTDHLHRDGPPDAGGTGPTEPALFDFGYCLTVHKSQGSEWPDVAVVEQLAEAWDARRWRYTAVTRASRRLTYFMRTR
jgi:exodeoxyribonuclease-5